MDESESTNNQSTTNNDLVAGQTVEPQQPSVQTPQPGAGATTSPTAPEVPSQQNVAGSVSGSGSLLSRLSNNKKWLWATATVVVAVLLVGGAYAYYEYSRPENRIKRAFSSLAQTEQAGADYTIDADIPSEGVSTKLSGSFDGNKQRFYASFGIDSFEAGEVALPSNFQPELEVIGVSGDEQTQDLYFKLGGVDKAVLDQYASSFGSQAAQAISDIYDSYHDSWIVVENVVELLGVDDGDNPQLTLTDSDQDKIADIVADARIVTIIEELESKDVNGRSSDGFVVEPDFDGIAEMVRQLEAAELDIVSQINDLEDSQGVDFDKIIDGLEEAEDSYDENSDELELQLWLDGSELTRMVTSLTPGDDSDDEGLVTMTVTMTEFDASLAQPPSDATPFQEVQRDIEQVLNQLFAPQPDFNQSQPSFNTFDTGSGGFSSLR